LPQVEVGLDELTLDLVPTVEAGLGAAV
jgi:hypothetical protein